MEKRLICLALVVVMAMLCGAGRAVSREGSSNESAADEIKHWASLPANGSEGRPMPLTGSWNIGRYYNQPWEKDQEIAWDPTYFTQLIERGHHVLPTFPDPMTRSEEPEGDFGILGVRFVPAIKYCAEHDLPFAFRDWNWADSVAKFEDKRGKDFSNDETVQFVKNGRQYGRKASPISPIERWREFGRSWGGNGYLKAMAKIYPNPPLIVFLNNNEAGEIGPGDVDANADRFVERYGPDLSKKKIAGIIHEGYKKRYQAMFEAAREAAPEGWADNMKFVAYNAFPWPKLRGVTPLQVDNPEKITDQFVEWSYFEGAMPEFYMNDWQFGRGKTDFSSWSPQAESTTYVPMANEVFKKRPDYYFASIGWEGRYPGHRRSPANGYATGDFGNGAVKKWDFDRYMGMIQFGLWGMRPRVMREFRGGATRDAYYQKTWDLYLKAVDRVWEREALQPFWKHGKLVENPDIKWQPGNPDHMQLKRWYMLACDANPSESEWPKIYQRKTVKLRVMALALVLGEKPERRWLVYAHAPLGAVKDAGITLPGFDKFKVDVSRSGSFYVIDEASRRMKTWWGGPKVVRLASRKVYGSSGSQLKRPVYMDQLNKKEKVKNERYFAAGDTIKVTPSFVADPRTRVQSAEWELGEKDVRQAEEVEEQEISFDTEGPQVLRLTVTTEEGQEITGETTIWIGEKPAPHVVYDVSLDHASRWSGPWRVIGQEWPGKLQRYRLVPNRGAATDPVLYGGTFVDDPEEGRVLEVNAQEGLWGERSQLTVNDDDGHSSKTISFRFKADDTSGRQTLYSEGHANAGFNVYLDDGMLYAGGWGVKEKFGSWDGNWISTDGIKAGTWYRVDLVLNDATDQVQDGKLHLYLDGEKVASGPAKRLPKHHSAPRLGRARSTRFHSGQTGGSPGLEGRLADFRVINAVRQPGK